MNVLILHYHLNPGGVTRIIESQISGIRLYDKNVRIKIICGLSVRLPQFEDVEIVQDCRLNYISDISDENPAGRLNEILTLLKSHITGKTIVHAHNPNLGKNAVLTVALFALAMEGIPVINHYHDFPEDRPLNMQTLEHTIPVLTNASVNQVLYPDLSNYFYAVLNSCDYSRLLEKNINKTQIRFLPNPVAEPASTNEPKSFLKKRVGAKLSLRSDALLCTYPVRAIARKNIGEFVLLAVLFADVADFAITLAPLNPLEIKAYNRWKDLCREHSVNIHYEAGESVNYEELIRASDFCITTSVREGFGMTYLEPWLAGTPVIGRDLPCVTKDLKEQGLVFPLLYKEFRVEIENRVVEFKDLQQYEQEAVIANTAENRSFRDTLRELNPFLKRFLSKIPDDILAKNKEIILQKFSITKYGEQILGVYSEVSW